MDTIHPWNTVPFEYLGLRFEDMEYLTVDQRPDTPRFESPSYTGHEIVPLIGRPDTPRVESPSYPGNDVAIAEGRPDIPNSGSSSYIGSDAFQVSDVLLSGSSPSQFNVPVGSSHGTSAGLMTAPLLPRNKARTKAPTLRESDWAPVKDRVLELLKVNTLSAVRDIVAEEIGFQAT